MSSISSLTPSYNYLIPINDNASNFIEGISADADAFSEQGHTNEWSISASFSLLGKSMTPEMGADAFSEQGHTNEWSISESFSPFSPLGKPMTPEMGAGEFSEQGHINGWPIIEPFSPFGETIAVEMSASSEHINAKDCLIKEVITPSDMFSPSGLIKSTMMTGAQINETVNKKRKTHIVDKRNKKQIEGVAKKIKQLKKPFACNYPDCDKSYLRKISLIRHQKIHLGKVLPCTSCSKLFVNKSSLLRHERSHTGIKPYPCPYTQICEKRFSEPKNVKKHLKDVHNVYSLPLSFLKAAALERDSAKGPIPKEAEVLIDRVNRAVTIPSAQKNRDTSHSEENNMTRPVSDSSSSVSPSSSMSEFEMMSSSSKINSLAVSKIVTSCQITKAQRKNCLIKKIYVCPVEECEREYSLKNDLKLHFREFHPEFSLNSMQNFGNISQLNANLANACDQDHR